MSSNRFTGVWNGLWHKKHHEKLGPAWMLFGYLLSRTNKKGIVTISYKDISFATGTSIRTLGYWMKILKREEYITVKKSKSMMIKIEKFRSLKTARPCRTEGKKILQDVAEPDPEVMQGLAEQSGNILPNHVRDVAESNSINSDKQSDSANPLNVFKIKDNNVSRPSLPAEDTVLSKDTINHE